MCALARGGTFRDARQAGPLLLTALAILVGTLPVVVAGVALEGSVERAFGSLTASGGFLCVTGLVLLASRFAPEPCRTTVGPGTGFLVGVAQAVALLPGISRSGSTIVAGYFLGLVRLEAARFSFLLAVPALAGAALWETVKALHSSDGRPLGMLADAGYATALATGTLVSAVVGACCLLLLLRIVRRGRLHWFGAYCLPAGLLMVTAGLLT